jgi:Domain of unknown function (DUF4383)
MRTPGLPRMGERQSRVAVGLALFWACVYLMLGILGLLVTGFDFYSNVTGVSLFGLTVNPNTNVIHLVTGIVGIALATTPVWARRALLLMGFLGLPWAIAGFLLDGTLSDFFATNTPMNTLHLVTAVSCLAVGLYPGPGTVPARTGETALGATPAATPARGAPKR